MKKQLNLSGAFSCLSRCLIYKVHTALLRRLSRIPHRFSFVKNFFRAFSNSFAALSSAGSTFAAPAALSDSLLRIPHSLPLVKNFFRNFSSPCPRRSRVRACILLCLRRSFDPSPKRLIILPEQRAFVNTFLHFFAFFHPSFSQRQRYTEILLAERQSL